MSNYRNEELARLARVFKALSNPNRLRLFAALTECCKPGTVAECCSEADAARYVGQLGEQLAITPSTVSHHLKELRDAGLMQTERHGQRIACWVDPAVLSEIAEFFRPGGG